MARRPRIAGGHRHAGQNGPAGDPAVLRRAVRVPRPRLSLRAQAIRYPKADRARGGRGRNPRRGRLLYLQPLVEPGRVQGPHHGPAVGALLSRPERRDHGDLFRHGSLAVQHQHPGLVEAGPPVPLHHSQRRDKHAAGQHQLDDRTGGHLLLGCPGGGCGEADAGVQPRTKRHGYSGQRSRATACHRPFAAPRPDDAHSRGLGRPYPHGPGQEGTSTSTIRR